MDKKLFSTTGLLIGLALFLAVNVFASAALRSMRVDLTENGLYSLSQGTKNILGDLEEPLTLRLYFSKKLAADFPQLQSYAQRVQEMLEEYAAASNGELSLEVIDPEPFSEEEDRAVAFGLQGARINAAGEQLYFGLAGTNTVDEELTVPFFDLGREQFLEYDLTELVYNLSNLEQRVVGIISSLPIFGAMPDPRQMQAPPQPWAIVQQMQNLFDVRQLDAATATELPSDLDVLMIVHPKGLTDPLLYAIDQYVLGGGKVFAFVDTFCEVEPPNPASQNPMMDPKNSELGTLLSAWGLELVPSKLAGDRGSAQQVNAGSGPIDFVLWMQLMGEQLSADDFATSGLQKGVVMHSAGVLKESAGTTATIEPLIQTSSESMEIDTFKIQFQPDPGAILDEFVSSGQNQLLAARVSGSASSAFPDGPPPGATPEETPPAETPEDDSEPEESGAEDHIASGEINAIVVSDVDLLADNSWSRMQNFLGSRIIYPIADNGAFVMNCLENLSGNNDLISLRSRGSFQRPFDKKRELERQADERFRAKEQELEAKLKATEQELNNLQQENESGSVQFLSPEQEAAIARFREEQLATRKELREVKHQLQKDIESLGSKLKFFNIALIPLIIAALSLGVSFFKRR